MFSHIKFILIFSLFVFIVTPWVCLASQDNLSNSIIGAWLFEEGSGEIAHDNSSNGHDGTLMNGTRWIPEGRFGKALEFDGIDDYVDVGTLTITAKNNQFTYQAWVYPYELRTQQTVARGQAWDDQDGDIQIRIEDSQGHIKPHVWAGSWTVFQSQGTIPANEWTHLSVTFDGETLTLYINGEPDKITANAVGSAVDEGNDNPVYFGAYQGEEGVEKTTAHYVGRIDEVVIANRAWTQEEIQKSMKGLVPIFSVEPKEKLALTWGSLKRDTN